jgi:hypothetical protein
MDYERITQEIRAESRRYYRVYSTTVNGIAYNVGDPVRLKSPYKNGYENIGHGVILSIWIRDDSYVRFVIGVGSVGRFDSFYAGVTDFSLGY